VADAPSDRLVGITVYPVKSAKGVAVATAGVERWGLRDDRRWAIVDADGRRLKTLRAPAIMSISATPRCDGGLDLSAPGVPDLVIGAPSPTNGYVPVDLYGLDQAVSGGAAADTWLSQVLGRHARLVWLDDPARRPVSPAHGGRSGDPLSLADAAPLLLITTASLRQLDAWIAARATREGEGQPPPLDPRRFRPNVVVDTNVPFIEENWTTVRIGDIRFRLAEHCDRCATTLIDPDTLQRGREPVRVLARHRRRDGKVWFGIRVIPETSGTIQVGDPVSPNAG
jgi:uncharacterized protein YcbX